MKQQNKNFMDADLSRRTVLMGGFVLAATSLLSHSVLASSDEPLKKLKGDITTRAVWFDNKGLKMAGNLYFPKGFTGNEKYPAIITVHPGGGVKEQTAGLYAQKLAEQGFVTLAFDASHQGASEGLPRFLDDPMRRVADISSAVDYLTTLSYVDAARIGTLGICAGSGTAVKAASLERRIKALATISAVDVGAATRKGWDGKASVADQLATLESVAKQRTAEAAGSEPVYLPYVPKVGDTTAPHDLQEAAEYYLTPRGQHPNAPNKLLMTSLAPLTSFSGFDQADTLLTQPIMIVAGSEAGSLWHSQELHAKASGKKELVIIDKATHMDLYDGEGATSVSNKLVPFFKQNL